jgi:hypothetical protein
MAKNDNTIWFILGAILLIAVAMHFGPGLMGTQSLTNAQCVALHPSTCSGNTLTYWMGSGSSYTDCVSSTATCQAPCYDGETYSACISTTTCTPSYTDCGTCSAELNGYKKCYDANTCTSDFVWTECTSTTCVSGTYDYDYCSDASDGCARMRDCTNGQWGSCHKVNAFCSACQPNWECGSWVTCSSSGIQTRICNDLNSCGVNTGRPSISQNCVPDSGTSTRGNSCITNSNCGTNEVCKSTMWTRICMDLTLDSCSIACSDKNNAGIAGGCTIDFCHVSMSASDTSCYTNEKKGMFNAYTDAKKCVNCIGGAEQMDPAVGAVSCCSETVVGTTCTFPTNGEGSNIKIGTVTLAPSNIPSITDINLAKTMTTAELARYSCEESADCTGSNASCIKMSYLTTQGIISKPTSDELFDKLATQIQKGAVGVAAGSIGGLALCAGTVLLTAGTEGAAAPLIPAVCGTLVTTGALVGGTLGGTMGINADKYATAIQNKDLEGVGICVAKSGGSSDILAWFTQQTVIPGIPNWGIVAAGLIILLLLTRR